MRKIERVGKTPWGGAVPFPDYELRVDGKKIGRVRGIGGGAIETTYLDRPQGQYDSFWDAEDELIKRAVKARILKRVHGPEEVWACGECDRVYPRNKLIAGRCPDPYCGGLVLPLSAKTLSDESLEKRLAEVRLLLKK